MFETAEIILTALRRDFGILNPRLAVAGLNPHAGEEGMLGDGGGRDHRPRDRGAEGARLCRDAARSPPTRCFTRRRGGRYDAALCMYHDQALIPIKTLSFWDGVNVTLGLPIVRTSPDHGTALDIAGTGKADPRSMIAAVKLAAAMADAREPISFRRCAR